MRESEWLEWRAERAVGGVSGEHAWVGTFVDDLVWAAADDQIVSVGGVPRLDETGGQCIVRKRTSMRRAACLYGARVGIGT